MRHADQSELSPLVRRCIPPLPAGLMACHASGNHPVTVVTLPRTDLGALGVIWLDE